RPPGLHTRVPAPKNRSRSLLLFQGVLVTRTLVRSLQATLERCAAAKLELLHAVKLTLRKRNRIVETQRTERRSPDDADTHRGAYHVAIVIYQTRTGSSRSRINRRRGAVRVGRGGEFGRLSPRGRSLIVKESTGFGID